MLNVKTEHKEGYKEETKSETWREVKRFTGEGKKNTESFTINGSKWRVKWKNTVTGEYKDNFILYLNYLDGEFCSYVNTPEYFGTKEDTTYCYDTDEFYLEIFNGEQWEIIVEELI